MSKEVDRKSDFDEAYNQAWGAWSTFQHESRNDLRAVTKWAWTQKDIEHMKRLQPEREIMSFPLLRRFTRLIGNFQRNNRLSLTYAPVENADEITADQLSMCGQFALNYGNGYHAVSDAFEGSLKTGMNLLNIANDSGFNTIFERYAYNAFLLHPGFTKRDLSDCQYGIMRKQIPMSEAIMLLPDHEPEIRAMSANKTDNKFPLMVRNNLYGDSLMCYDEFQQRDTVKKRFLVMAGQTMMDGAGNKVEWRGTKRQLEEMQLFYPELDTVTEWVRSIKVTAYLNGEEMWDAADPWGIGDFSFTPVICFFDPEEEQMELRIQSAVRGMKDAQRVHDRRTIANLMAVETVIGAGLDVEEGALVDDEQAYTAGPGKPRFFKDGAITENRFRDRQATSLPGGYMELQGSFDALMGKIINLNEDGLMGVDQKDQLLLGVVGKMRMGLGMIGMFDFFDNLSLAQKVLGSKLLKLIQQYPADRVQRICNAQPSPAFYNREFGKYDCVPAETALTDTQRNQLYTELLNLKRMGAEMGDPFPAPWSLLMKYAPVAMKQDYMRAIAELEKQQQQKQAENERLQRIAQQLEMAKAQADIAADRGRAIERQTQASENQAGAALDRIKTAVEIRNAQLQPEMEAYKLMLEEQKVNQMHQSNGGTR